jgi:uncharacterized protein
MLLLSGTRDALADRTLLEALVGRLGGQATLRLIADADHSFHVPARSGRSGAQALLEVLTLLTAWIHTLM